MGSHRYGPIQANDNSRLHLGDVNHYGDREQLKYVPGALFNAYGLDYKACHPETRRELLEEIESWAEHPTGHRIFWLNGMAGTGKSTIAYTVAKRLNEARSSGHAKLGASFFFKRGEGDRASAALFFPTIVRQLCQKMPDLAAHIDQAIIMDPDICSKALDEQFDKLLNEPLSKLSGSLTLTTYIVVVDAIDECQNEDDVWTLLQLWSRLSRYRHRYIRLFLTTRPELAIQLGFSRMPTDAHRNVVLHEISSPTITRDISIFLADTLSQTRDAYNFMPLSGIPLPEDWPGATVLQQLTQMAVPLFIIAATICRFVQDRDFEPQEQLQAILQSRRIGQFSDLGQTYLPILERITSSSINKATQHLIYQEFRLIVGALITIAEPLSRCGLAVILQLPQATVTLRLRLLHSVIKVPQQAEGPVRLLHLSFGEFLGSEEIRNQPFWIDRVATHAVLLTKCLDLLSQPTPIGLGENMCQLSYPGQPRTALSQTVIHSRLSPAIRYACRYWTYHAQQSAIKLCDNGEVHHFLQTHFLHWLESLSLLGCLSDVIRDIGTLQSLLAIEGQRRVSAFLEDARRFVLAKRYIGDLAPLQLYGSAIIFTPQTSIVRQICGKIPKWILRTPITLETWSAELQKLEGHTGRVNAVVFSLDGSHLASASDDMTIRLWNAKTGQEVRVIEDIPNVYEIAFPDNGQYLLN